LIFLPLTLTLSLRERGQIEHGFALLLSQGTGGQIEHGLTFPLSPGERAGVRGKT